MWGATNFTLAVDRDFKFQSTLPVWGATGVFQTENQNEQISIHAPRVGSDGFLQPQGQGWIYFNPRSPCGERLGTNSFISFCIYFNPRSPCGERQIPLDNLLNVAKFQSTLPVWGATFRYLLPNQNPYISIHAPRVGSDSGLIRILRDQAISIHAPRVGSDCPAGGISAH